MFRVLLATVCSLTFWSLWGHLAHAEEAATWAIKSYYIDAVFNDDGSAHVTSQLTFQYGDTPGHGPLLTFPTKQEIKNDPRNWRKIRYTNFNVRSADAPDKMQVSEDLDTLSLKIGDPEITISGTHSYLIEYDVDGLAWPASEESAQAVIEWIPIGSNLQIPIQSVQVTVTAPQKAIAQHCWIDTLEAGCTINNKQSSQSMFTSSGLEKGQQLRVSASYPANTFSSVQVDTMPRFSTAAIEPNLGNIISGSVVFLIVVIAAGILHEKPSFKYKDVALGIRLGKDAPVVAFRGKITGSKRTTPPDCFPFEIQQVYPKAKADVRVAVTILDMAARKVIKIEPEALLNSVTGQPRKVVWRMSLTQPGVNLGGHAIERAVRSTLFQDSNSLTTAELRLPHEEGSSIARQMNKAVTHTLEQMPDYQGWHQTNNTRNYIVSLVFPITLLVLSLVWTIACLLFDINLLWPAIIGIVSGVFFMTKAISWHPPLTADGTAIWAQADGFRQWLRTVSPDEIELTEDVDLYALYLPWAVALGATQHWSTTFRELDRQGKYDMTRSALGRLEISKFVASVNPSER